MRKLVTEAEYLLAWFLYWISTVVGGLILGALAGMIAGGVLGTAGVGLAKIKLICGALGFIVSIPISYGLFRLFVASMIVGKIEKKLAVPVPPALDGSIPPG